MVKHKFNWTERKNKKRKMWKFIVKHGLLLKQRKEEKVQWKHFLSEARRKRCECSKS